MSSQIQPRLPAVAARDPREIIDEAVELYGIQTLWGCFSGGTDSLVACFHASKHPKFAGVVSIDTTIAVDETHQYVRSTCEAMGWPLIMQTTPNNWGWLTVKFGLLGPAYHQTAYINLKERAFREAVKQIQKRGDGTIGFVSGARRAESKRRAKNVTYHRKGDGPVIWINPIADYHDTDKRAVMTDEGLTPSEVSKRLCMSGDCLCGTTFEHERERRAEIRAAYPAAEAKIAAAEQLAKAYGKHCQWATRPEKKPTELAEDDPQLMLDLCWSCQAKQE